MLVSKRSTRRKRKYSYQCREVSSYKIFTQFVKYTTDPFSGKRKCDATDILSKECYMKWLSSRRTFPKKPQEAFRRALTAHCRGVDGRRPFTEEMEESLLTELRKKKQWRCFEGSKDCGSIGVQGFPSLGYHEKRRGDKPQASKKKVVKAEPFNNQTVAVSGMRAEDFFFPIPEGYMQTDLSALYDNYEPFQRDYAPTVFETSPRQFYPVSYEAQRSKRMKMEQTEAQRRSSAVLAEYCVKNLASLQQRQTFNFVC